MKIDRSFIALNDLATVIMACQNVTLATDGSALNRAMPINLDAVERDDCCFFTWGGYDWALFRSVRILLCRR